MMHILQVESPSALKCTEALPCEDALRIADEKEKVIISTKPVVTSRGAAKDTNPNYTLVSF